MSLYKIIKVTQNGITVVEEKEFDRLGDAEAYALQLEITHLDDPNPDYAPYFAEVVYTCNYIQNVPELTIEPVKEQVKKPTFVSTWVGKPKSTTHIKLSDEERLKKIEDENAKLWPMHLAAYNAQPQQYRSSEFFTLTSIIVVIAATISAVIMLITLCGNIFSWGEKQYYYHYYSDAEQHLLNQRTDYNANVVDNFVNEIEEHKNNCEAYYYNSSGKGCSSNEIENWTSNFVQNCNITLNNLRQEHEDRLFAEKMKRAQKYMGE